MKIKIYIAPFCLTLTIYILHTHSQYFWNGFNSSKRSRDVRRIHPSHRYLQSHINLHHLHKNYFLHLLL